MVIPTENENRSIVLGKLQKDEILPECFTKTLCSG